ncbi:MAG: hypothetical protein N2038_14775 [Geminicoccaceae bacterium]|nr:hypothetical protein [Geminicoccaceae bacterium]MCS7269212.1 hypothetical protein [Geminicoccaceae bacterium]MCX7631491.1 hypothetical protein [Geminicoccaceae bacterium]
MKANGSSASEPDRIGAIWRAALARLTARLEEEGLDRERARELGESAVIVCLLRQSRAPGPDQAFALALEQARAMR